MTASANSQDGEFSAFDFYAGGINYGLVYGRFGEGWFELDAPQDAVDLLPAVRNPDNFIPLFDGRIEKIRMIRDVGTVSVDITNFRLNVDIDQAESLLSAVEGLGDLQGTDKDISLRNALFVAGSANTRSLDILRGVSMSHDSVLSKGDMALQSSGTLTQDNGYVLKNALVRKDFRVWDEDMTAFAGMLETSGNMRFARSLDFMGLRLASNQTLLFRDEQLQGSNIEIFLPRRAQVEVFRDRESSRQVLYSRILNFGTVQIDTRGFPQGSYDIEIVVRDGGTVISREVRPYIKTQLLPPHGKPVMSLEIGETRDGTRPEGIPAAEISYRARLSDWLGGGVGLAATSKDHVYEVSLSSQKGLHVFEAIGLLETSLTGAFSNVFKPVGVEASAVWRGGQGGSASLFATKIYDRGRANASAGDFSLSDRESLSFSIAKPLLIGGYRVFSSFGAETSRSSLEGSSYRYGPAFSYVFDKRGAYTPELKFEYNVSDEDKRMLATFSLRDSAPVWSKNAQIDASRIGSDNRVAVMAGLGYTGAGAAYKDWRRKLDATLGLRMDPLLSSTDELQTVISSDAIYTGELAQLRGYLEQAVTQEASGQIGGELRSTLLWSPSRGLKATSQAATNDMALAMITVEGEEGDDLDVTMNGATLARVRTGETVALPVPVYKKIRVDVVDTANKGILKSREKGQVVVGYPGNVVYRTFTMAKAVVVTGFLVDEQDLPLDNARFLLDGQAYYTDEAGFFALDVMTGTGQSLAFAAENHICMVEFPALKKEDVYADLGNVSCVKKTGSP